MLDVTSVPQNDRAGNDRAGNDRAAGGRREAGNDRAGNDRAAGGRQVIGAPCSGSAGRYVCAMALPPVLLVHGFASSYERNWREPGWVDILGDEGREVIPLDLPGHGGAEKPHDPQAYAGMENAVESALPADGPVDAIGFSLGGQLLLKVVAGQPARFRKVVVGGVGDNIFRHDDPEAAARAIETGSVAEGAPAVAQAFAVFAKAPGNDPAALAACLRRPRDPMAPDDLSRVSVPVLVVLGERDFAGPADKLMAALPDARLVSLTAADHFGTPKDFRFIEAAMDFLRD
jgi:pimeloyl-ACP methyl ester carboxylesterase